MSPRSLRERVAEALYNEPTKSPMNRMPWPDLPDDRKAAWLDDADRVIPIVLGFAADMMDARDPDKPANWNIRREHAAEALRRLYA